MRGEEEVFDYKTRSLYIVNKPKLIRYDPDTTDEFSKSEIIHAFRIFMEKS